MAKAKKTTPAVESTKKIVDSYFDVIVKPVVTEKSMVLTQKENKVVVAVKKDASKESIKDAFEAIFAVKVEKVNVINVAPRAKKMGRYEGTVPAYKKAIIKLAEGQSLDIYQRATEENDNK